MDKRIRLITGSDLKVDVSKRQNKKVGLDVPSTLPAHALAQHNDMPVPMDGNAIRYDAATQKWVNFVPLTQTVANLLYYPLGSNPSGYLTTETDPVFSASPAAGVTNTLVNNWNAAFASSHTAATIGTANGLSIAGQVISLQNATTSQPGALSAADWNTFNNKAPKLAVNGLTYTEGTGFLLGGTLTQNTTISGGSGASGKQLTLALATGIGSIPSMILGSYNGDGANSWIYGYDSSNKGELMRLESNTAAADFVLRVRNGSAPRTIRISAGINDTSFIDLGGLRMRSQSSRLGIGATFAAGSGVDARLHLHGDTNAANTPNVIFERFDRAKTLELMGDHQAKFYGQIYLTSGNLRLDQTIAGSAGASAGYITLNLNGTTYKIQVYAN